MSINTADWEKYTSCFIFIFWRWSWENVNLLEKVEKTFDFATRDVPLVKD